MKNEEYKFKQDWLEAVMASDLPPATKVYAFGVYKHMYGNKVDSWPGAKALKDATNLSDGHYYKYNKALGDAGYLEVTSRRGTSNEYRLTLPTPTGGTHIPPQEVTLPREEVTPTSTGGTNTTSNTTMNNTIQDKTTVVADAPTVPSNFEVRESGVDDNPSLTLEKPLGPQTGIKGTQKDIDAYLRSRLAGLR